MSTDYSKIKIEVSLGAATKDLNLVAISEYLKNIAACQIVADTGLESEVFDSTITVSAEGHGSGGTTKEDLQVLAEQIESHMHHYFGLNVDKALVVFNCVYGFEDFEIVAQFSHSG